MPCVVVGDIPRSLMSVTCYGSSNKMHTYAFAVNPRMYAGVCRCVPWRHRKHRALGSKQTHKPRIIFVHSSTHSATPKTLVHVDVEKKSLQEALIEHGAAVSSPEKREHTRYTPGN